MDIPVPGVVWNPVFSSLGVHLCRSGIAKSQGKSIFNPLRNLSSFRSSADKCAEQATCS